ncbi:MAG: hypothetical protein WC852_07500 [Candidatus Nanoarchaeia archaeon]|jgi:hypothetical protein
MKAKTVLIVLIVALLCTSIASAGFTEWVTGKAISLKSIFSKKAVTNSEITNTGVKTEITNSGVKAAAANKVSPAEFDSTPVKFSGDQLLTHVDNRLRQMENSLGLTARKWDTSIKNDALMEVKA